ncbi:MAG TPA: YCF48-related protein [Pseudonocardia sp.]|uniref:YCF48-related protein n=1 Tax=Pseudonocardia sp. TaxID=60912 RepID=UPI002F4299B3
MGRFQRVREILDEAIGGPDATIGAHGPFWRGLTRDQFVAKKVIGKPLLAVGDGAASNIVRAFKGEAPFGADLDPPTEGASFSRMPAGLPPVPAGSIAFVQQWIDDGCPDDVEPESTPVWRPTNAPVASSRTDDIWFVDPLRGWAVNSNGQILHTTDGFASYQEQFHDEDVYLRCVGFADPTHGWVGTLTPGRQLLHTTDGGATWADVVGLPAFAPPAVCGLSVVDANVVYASGTNYPNRPARMMRTLDGAATWEAWDMAPHATLLIDNYFTDVDHGWVVGGKATVPNPGREDVRAVVLRTEDGGRTWVDRAAPLAAQLPLGEWGWKIHFIDDRVGYVALESFERGAILKTTDGGDSWTRIDIDDPQGNVNLEGVGFLDESTGWVGGWGVAFVGDDQAGFSSSTTDGGKTWRDANDIGRFINRFRFFRGPDPIGYASGLTVYRYSAAPRVTALAAPSERLRLLDDNTPRRATAPLELAVTVPGAASSLKVDVWDRFGSKVRRVVAETGPARGPRTVVWDGTDDGGAPLGAGSFIIRMTVDGHSESQILHIID